MGLTLFAITFICFISIFNAILCDVINVIVDIIINYFTNQKI